NTKLLNRALVNQSTIVVPMNITLGTNAAITNQSTGIFDLQNDADLVSFQGYGNSTPFQNAGLLKKSTGDSTSGLDVVMTNSGQVLVESGTLQLALGMTNSGTVTVNDGMRLSIS